MGENGGAVLGPQYTGALTSIKSFFRLADGVRTVFLVGKDSRLVDIVDMERWATQVSGGQDLAVPCAAPYAAHARGTLTGGHVGVVLSPQREIKVFARGEQVFAFRNADWHLLDLVGEVSDVGDRGGLRHAGAVAVPDRARPVGCAAGCAVRRAAPPARDAGGDGDAG